MKPETTFDLEMLIVDDNRSMLSLLRSIFRQLGVERVEMFEQADLALEYLSHVIPDLILTDWEMEPMSGIEFVRLLRRHPNPEIRRIPIVMVTAHADAQRVMEARDAGVTEFLVKPISHKAVSEKLRAVIAKPRLFVRTLDYTGPDRRRTTKPFSGGEHRRDVGHFFDLAPPDDGGDARDGDEGISRMGPHDLRAYFEDTLSQRIAAVCAELDAAETDTAANRRGHIGRMFRMVHDLKGQGGTFNYPLITDLGTALCAFVDGAHDFEESEIAIIRKFVESMRVVADHRIHQDGGDTDRALLGKMNQIVQNYEAARAEAVRPDAGSGNGDVS